MHISITSANIAEATEFVKLMPRANICQCKFGSVFTGSDGAQLKRELLFFKKVLLLHKHFETYFDPSNCSRLAILSCVCACACMCVCVAARVVQAYKAVGLLLHFRVTYVV